MASWSNKKTTALVIIALVSLVLFFKLNMTGKDMAFFTKLLWSGFLTLLGAVMLYLKEPKQ